MIGLKESTSVTSLYREFSLSLSKALGCKRVHDDRIAGVTFEENASRNALIVNKEYAWVGNPFSAPKQQGGPQWFSLLLWVLSCGFVPGDLNAPLPGAGGVDKQSRNHSCAARVRVPFSAPEGTGRELRKKVKTLYITDIPPPTPVEAKGSKHCWRSSANTARNASQTLGYTNTNMAESVN